MSCPVRLHPFRKPKNHRTPVPRWKLSLPECITHVFTAYLGVQQHAEHSVAAQAKLQAIKAIQDWIESAYGPSASESFTTIDGHDLQGTVVWICYWENTESRNAALKALSMPLMYEKLDITGRSNIGIWRESFTTPFSRLETNYSGLDYLPGLARLPNATTEEHSLSAYWGAARDRIPDSAHDLFLGVRDTEFSCQIPLGIGQHLMGTNHANLAHIRSGQFWENCGREEAESYVSKLEPTLEAGLRYLYESPLQTGAAGLRYLRNQDLPSTGSSCERKETCGAGFFRNLENLESWAKSHPSHLKIYGGALAHYKIFGDSRLFRTWHEVSIISEGDATFEYINCKPETGVMGQIPLQAQCYTFA